MKKIITCSLFLCLFIANSNAALLSLPVSPKNHELNIVSIIKDIPVEKLAQMNWKDLEKISGQKLSIQDKIAFKLYKKNSKTETISSASKTSFTLAILSLATLFIPIISIPFAIAGIVTASKALKKDDEDVKAKRAMALSLLSLGIVVVATLIYAIFISNAPFSIFIF